MRISLQLLTGRFTSRLARTQRGASLIEYALLLAFIAIVAVISVGFLGTSVSHQMSRGGSGLS